MSLEKALQENTAAILALTAALAASGVSIAAPTAKADPKQNAIAEKKANSDDAALAGAVEKQKAADAAAEKENTARTENAGIAIDYDTVVKPLIKTLGEKDRATALALLSRFGAKNGKELKPEQYAAFVTRAQDVLQGGEV